MTRSPLIRVVVNLCLIAAMVIQPMAMVARAGEVVLKVNAAARPKRSVTAAGAVKSKRTASCAVAVAVAKLKPAGPARRSPQSAK